ncbi:MAG TPA: peroxidase [Phycisphaerae bacterium]|jgi:deferrochelatase/peroxidase EfeB
MSGSGVVAGQMPGNAPATDAAPLPLTDIQGVILRGYNFPAVRHFVLQVLNASAARKVMGQLVAGTDPQISDSTDWGDARPDYRLQVSLTYAGLAALELDPATLQGFQNHRAFFEGAGARAASLGDVGPSAPQNWIGGMNDASRVHILVSLYATDASLENRTTSLRALWPAAMTELSVHTGNVLPDHSVHFGYQDGISQPTIIGAPAPTSPSTPAAPPSSFLLGYDSPWPSFNLPVPPPDPVFRNGSFAAFGIMEQDVAAFENFLTTAAAASGHDREWVAAKICGRWRSGVPLILSPDSPAPNPAIADEDLDNFDYTQDPHGQRCPFASHSRRAFPRTDFIAGGQGAAFRHRIIRRGMPYGPPFDPAHPTNEPRGLLGMFICASIEDQFEFIVTEWINKGGFTGALSVDNRDPLVGTVPSGTTGTMPVPNAGGPATILQGFQRFITKRGSAYVFFPSLTALRYIGSL